jgi:hypothetical protein
VKWHMNFRYPTWDNTNHSFGLRPSGNHNGPPGNQPLVSAPHQSTRQAKLSAAGAAMHGLLTNPP